MAALDVEYVSDAAKAHDATQSAATVDQATASTGALIASVIFICVLVMLVIADLRAWYYNASQVVRRTDRMMKKVRTDLDNIEGISSHLLLTSIPDSYKHIREYDHYKSKAWSLPHLNTRRKKSASLSSIGGGSRNSIVPAAPRHTSPIGPQS
jgi:hypothetical protein